MVRRRSAAVPRPLSAVRAAFRRARLVLVIFHQPFQRFASESAGFHEAQGREKAVVENAGGDMKPARGFASDKGGKPCQRDMHRRLDEIAALELPFRPGEVFERVRRDIARVRHGQERQKAVVLTAVPRRPERVRPASR